jgi:hypothetical protein
MPSSPYASPAQAKVRARLGILDLHLFYSCVQDLKACIHFALTHNLYRLCRAAIGGTRPRDARAGAFVLNNTSHLISWRTELPD